MSFQIKDFTSIVASMINHMRGTQNKVTDFRVGGVARTMMEAPAVEIEELYQQMFIGIREAIPVVIFNSFGFEKLPARTSFGTVRFSAASAPPSPILISAGTQVRVPNSEVTYSVQNDTFLTAPATFSDIVVIADVVGTAGNAPANTITELVTPVNGIISVTNPLNFENGADVETEDQRKARFQAYIATLPRATGAALEFGAKTAFLVNVSGEVTELVRFAKVNEPYLTDQSQPVGFVRLFVHNGIGGTSAALVAETQRVIDGYYLPDGTEVPGYKAAGVVVQVLACTDVPVPVSGSITVLQGFVVSSVVELARQAVSAYIAALAPGEKVIRAEIVSAIMAIPGVYNVSLTAPAADVTMTLGQKPMVGAFNLTGTVLP